MAGSNPEPDACPAADYRASVGRWNPLVTLGFGTLVLIGFALSYGLHRWGAPTPRTGADLFSPLTNNLSYLGRTFDPSGRSNVPGALVFAFSLCGVGALFIHFWIWRSRWIPDRHWSDVARACGVLMGLFLLAVGLLPENLYPRAHNLLIFPPVLFGALAMLSTVLGPDFGLESPDSRRWTRVLIGVLVAVSVVLKAAQLLGWIPRKPALPVMQKMLILFLVAWTLRQAVLFLLRAAPAEAAPRHPPAASGSAPARRAGCCSAGTQP